MKKREIFRNWIALNKKFWSDLKDQKRMTQNQVDSYLQLYKNVHESATPCFILSTGRCGTKLITEILEENSSVKVIHDYKPEPTWHSNWAYHNFRTNSANVSHVIDALRYELIRDAYLLEKQYVETNNRITFFAHQLAKLYPNSKFIHLYRAPDSFVNSGIGRGWYNDNIITDEGRLHPSDLTGEWALNSQTKKIAWLWNATNQFIEDFKSAIQPQRIITVQAENLFRDPTEMFNIFKFLGAPHPTHDWIEAKLKIPVNQQQKHQLVSLDKVQKKEIKDNSPLAFTYGYY